MEFIGFLFLIAFLLFFIFIFWAISSSSKENIEKEIRRNGGQVIQISTQFFSGGKGNNSYKVVFADQNGKKYQTFCQINQWGGKIYWTATPKELLSDVQQVPNISIQTGPTYYETPGTINLNSIVKSSKEQIIDDLHEENTRLKAELERLRKTNHLGGSEL